MTDYDVSIQNENKERRSTEYGVLWNPGANDEIWSSYGPLKETAAKLLRMNKVRFPDAISMQREVITTKWSRTTPHDETAHKSEWNKE